MSDKKKPAPKPAKPMPPKNTIEKASQPDIKKANKK